MGRCGSNLKRTDKKRAARDRELAERLSRRERAERDHLPTMSRQGTAELFAHRRDDDNSKSEV
jgi:hypothetical protein